MSFVGKENVETINLSILFSSLIKMTLNLFRTF